LTWKEVLAMEKDGILFGSHGHSHRDLTALTQRQVRRELETSKKILEDKLGKPIAYIAYPFSKSNGVVENLALECGYKTSFSAIGAEAGRRQSMQRKNSVVLRRSVIKKDDMLSFEFVLASTYHYYFDLQRMLGLSKVGRA
jgi:peptidoglycan/xylan/chitin deacetylase (PgdA/CDA1 family)